MYNFVLLVLFCASVVQCKIESFEDLQNLILKTIDETAPDFEPCNEKLLQKAKFGDMIEIKRFTYFHWSVYVGRGYVIQLDNPEFDSIKMNPLTAFNNFTGNVEFQNLTKLAKNDFCRINNKITESKRRGLKVLSDTEIEKKMEYELEHGARYYNIFKYNCEHFATKLRFGVPFSSQIDAVEKIEKENKDFSDTVTEMFLAATSAHSTEISGITLDDILALAD